MRVRSWGRQTLEATHYFRDWGPWGWVWAGGLYTFLLGLIVAPLALTGAVPSALLLLALPGAVLMRAGTTVRERSGLETNI